MTTKLTQKVPRNACQLQAQDGITFELLAPAEGSTEVKREWQMLAHTGKVVSRWWGRLVLDMDGAKYRQKLALLMDHNTGQRLGYSNKVERTKRGIEASGRLLTNALADQILAESREGFPWQASLMAVPTKVEQLESGVEAKVNGQKVKGPVTIFREWEMHELTLTTLGADENTSTEAFAANGDIEVEVTMTKKIEEPAAEPATLAAQVPTPQPVAPAIVAPPKPEDLEHQRASKILDAADQSQFQLAQELIKAKTPLDEALSRLNQDLRQRLQAASQNLRVAAEPISAGNSTGRDGSGDRAPVNLSDLPDDPEFLKAEWNRNVQLRQSFDSEKVLLSWRRNKDRCVHLHSGQLAGAERLGGSLKSLGYRNVQGNYFMALEERTAAMWSPRIATMLDTDQASEIYKWLGSVPNPTKWTGERKRQQLSDFGLHVIGEKYEDTVEVDVDDLRRDKTGQILKRVSELGAKMATLPQRLITDLLTNNPTAYDGLSFFNTAHVVGGSGTQSNDITVSGLTTPDDPTSAGMATAILRGVQQLIGLLDDRGDPMNEDAQRFTLLVPTKYMAATIAALKDQFTSAGVSNTLLNTSFSITPFVNPRLSGAASAAGRRIYLFREDASVRSIIWQDENIPDAFKTQDINSESGFWRDVISYGAKRIVAVAPGRFELGLRINLAA